MVEEAWEKNYLKKYFPGKQTLILERTAAESKDALAADGRVPFLIVKGRKGGSAMAVATVNALASETE